MGEDSSSRAESARLVPDVLRGDARAFEAWFRAEHPAVWRLCLGFLADSTRADDCAQDAMLHLHDHLSDWDPTRSWEAWRNTVVLNLCRDAERSEQRRRRAHERLQLERARGDAHEPPAHASLEQTERRALIVASLAALSPREREAFVLCELEERPTEEVAAAMQIGASSVRSLVALARRRLGSQLALRTEQDGGA
ncbi:MAG: RNA polymerase sigma factor [Planctomycetota bacterium]|nr:MAG: RNA polymerase sigma factor [Planctomycetota bacterium]